MVQRIAAVTLGGAMELQAGEAAISPSDLARWSQFVGEKKAGHRGCGEYRDISGLGGRTFLTGIPMIPMRFED